MARIRHEYIQTALETYSGLMEVLARMTEEEVLHALELETSSRRRKTIISRLISRAVAIEEKRYRRKLKEQFNVT